MLDADRRAKLLAAKAKVRELLKPEREKAKIRRAQVRKISAKARKAAPAKNQRQPRVREPSYLAFLRRQPCLYRGCRASRCDAAHIRYVPHGSGWRHVGGMEKPDDWRAGPLCREHHTLQHSMSERRFWEEVLRLDPVAEVTKLRTLFANQESKR